MDEYFCPKCGAILNHQDGFNPECNAWTCKECGQVLMDEDTYHGERYEGVAWYCDDCGARLNKQFGFSDSQSTWTCTECYHTNEISENAIYESEEEYKKSEATSELSSALADVICSAATVAGKTAKKVYEEKRKEAEMLEKIRQEEERIEREKRRAWRRKHRKEIAITTIIVLVCLALMSGYIVYKQLIPIRYQYEELIGTNLDIVIDKLEASGFSNINTKEISDLKLEEENNENIVTEIIIKDKTDFSADTKFFPMEKITIVYHTLEKIYAPLTLKEAKKLDYKEVVKKFKENGFINIKVEPIYDIITGWMTHDGEVETITINGDEDFNTVSSYKIDDEVTITYHTFKKNKDK